MRLCDGFALAGSSPLSPGGEPSHHSPTGRETAVIPTSNYGEAGAVQRYGARYGLPNSHSGQNQLYYQARPPESVSVVVMVGAQLHEARAHFRSCRTVGYLDNGLGVDNEEQAQPIAVCRRPVGGWPTVWPAYDTSTELTGSCRGRIRTLPCWP